MTTSSILRHLCRLFILLLMLGSAALIPRVPPLLAQSASAQVALRIAVSSIGDAPGGAIVVRSAVSHQLNRWTINQPRQTLLLPRGGVIHLSETPTVACRCLFRWILSGNSGAFHRKLVTKRNTSFMIMGATRVTAEYVKVSGDISLVPTRPDVLLQPLSAAQVRISPFAALDVANADWGLSDQQIDRHVGVVRALISLKHDLLHQNIKAWIVAADIQTYCPAPGCNTVYSRMVIVVDVETGRAVFSYPTDPSPRTPAMGPPPVVTPPPPGVYPSGGTSTSPTPTPPATPTVGTPGPWTGRGPAPTPTPTMHA